MNALQELQAGFQKWPTSEGPGGKGGTAKATKEQSLSDRNYVGEPKALRALQAQTLAKMQELVSQLVQETVPRLLEIKRQLTVAGSSTKHSQCARRSNNFRIRFSLFHARRSERRFPRTRCLKLTPRIVLARTSSIRTRRLRSAVSWEDFGRIRRTENYSSFTSRVERPATRGCNVPSRRMTTTSRKRSSSTTRFW